MYIVVLNARTCRQVVVILCCQCESYVTNMVFIEKCSSFHTPFLDVIILCVISTLHFCMLLILHVFSSVEYTIMQFGKHLERIDFFFASSTKCDFCVCVCVCMSTK